MLRNVPSIPICLKFLSSTFLKDTLFYQVLSLNLLIQSSSGSYSSNRLGDISYSLIFTHRTMPAHEEQTPFSCGQWSLWCVVGLDRMFVKDFVPIFNS